MSEHAIVDLRVYTIRLRKMAEFIEVFDRLAMPLQLKYLGRPLGMFTSAVGPLNQLVHLWGFPDMGEFERRHAAGQGSGLAGLSEGLRASHRGPGKPLDPQG